MKEKKGITGYETGGSRNPTIKRLLFNFEGSSLEDKSEPNDNEWENWSTVHLSEKWKILREEKWKQKESQDMKQVADQRSDKLMHDGIWEGLHDKEGVFGS